MGFRLAKGGLGVADGLGESTIGMGVFGQRPLSWRSDMLVTCVHVEVKPEFVEDFARASAENSAGSLQEPGNLRFDVLQSEEDPTQFLLYEAYENEAAAAAHKQTVHYQKWKSTVEDWMARPRSGVKHRVVYPDARERW